MPMKAKEIRKAVRTKDTMVFVATAMFPGQPVWIPVRKFEILHVMTGIAPNTELDAKIESGNVFIGVEMGRREATNA